MATRLPPLCVVFGRTLRTTGVQTGCDAEADAMVGQEIYEFKSWSPVHKVDDGEEDAEKKYDRTKSQFWNFERGYSGYTQFLCYLQNINTLDNLNYIFDQKLLEHNGQNLTFVKQTFQNLFRNKAIDLYKDVNQGGIGIIRFQQLFGVPDLPSFLNNKVNNLNDPIYNFIDWK